MPAPALAGRATRAAFAAAGFLLVALGVLGALLPLLPTTPFLLLAAACFVRGSPRAYAWLLEHRLFGDAIRAFREGRGIRRRAKACALALMWISMAASAYAVGDSRVIVAMILMGAIVTLYLLALPTAP